MLLAVCLMLVCMVPEACWNDATSSLQIVLAKLACRGLIPLLSFFSPLVILIL